MDKYKECPKCYSAAEYSWALEKYFCSNCLNKIEVESMDRYRVQQTYNDSFSSYTVNYPDSTATICEGCTKAEAELIAKLLNENLDRSKEMFK